MFHSMLPQIMQMLLCFNRIITQMPSSSAPCLLKFPVDLLPVEPGVLQQDRNTFGALLFNMFECAHFPSLIQIDCKSEGALLKLKADKADTAPCTQVAKRTICSHFLLKEEWGREINCKYSEKHHKALKLAFFTLKISQQRK